MIGVSVKAFFAFILIYIIITSNSVQAFSQERAFDNTIINHNEKLAYEPTSESLLPPLGDVSQASQEFTYSHRLQVPVYSADELDNLPEDEMMILRRAEKYYQNGMYSDAKNILSGTVSKESEILKQKIEQDNAITLTPNYSFFIQQLADTYKLNINRTGIDVSKHVGNNMTVFAEYNMYIYSSGNFGGGNHLNNVTNEICAGFQGRPTWKWAVRGDVGVKFFQFGGAMLNTDDWIKYYFNDTLNVKAGFRRNNVEQSYLSAVGFPVNGVFTGRAADNVFYLEYDKKLPQQFYSYGNVGYGLITGQNLITNQYVEGTLAFGKILYKTPEDKWINFVSSEIATYNASYQYNLLNIYDNTGRVFGGYFSPGFYNANTVSLKMQGQYKKLRYGLKGFVGGQAAITPDMASVIWGIAPYISLKINDQITFNALYYQYNYADIQRHQLMLNADIRLFKKNKKY